MSSLKRKPSIIPMTLKSGLAPAPPTGCVNRIILKLLRLPYPAGRVSFILPWKIYPAREQSLKSKLQHPLPVNPLDI